MRRRGGIKTDLASFLIEFQDILHHGGTILFLRSEDFQESPGVHRRFFLDSERIVAIAYVRHSGDSPFPHNIHPMTDVGDLLLEWFRVSQSIDLVDKTSHPGPFTEELPHVGKLNMAMRVDKTGNNRPLKEYFFLGRVLTFPDRCDKATMVVLHITVPDRIGTVQGVNVLRR